MTTTEIEDIITRFASAWAERNGEAFLALWHPEGTLYYPYTDRPIKGSELARLNQLQKEALPDLVWQLLD